MAEIPRVQLALDPLRESPALWKDAPSLLQQNSVAIVSGMFGCVGEDYSTLETIRATGGLAPDGTWPQNMSNIRANAATAERLGIRLVTFHAGFLPHDQASSGFSKLLERIRTAVGILAARNINVALETGQETARSLAAVLQTLDCPNLGVNFDPANMILYNQGDPIEAVRILGPWIRQVHIKDAKRTATPGTWGQEVVVGTGDVNWAKLFSTLREINFAGNFVIEREAGVQRLIDVCRARDIVLKSSQAN